MVLSFVRVCVCVSSLDSSVVSDVVLRDLLAYVSTKHPYLRDLPHRRPQRVNCIESVELEQLQSDTPVHAVVRVVDVTVLTGKHLTTSFLSGFRDTDCGRTPFLGVIP